MTVFNKSKSLSFVLSVVLVLGLTASLSLLCFAGVAAPAASVTKIIDVSEWNPTINWTLTSANCDGVILRIGYRRTVSKDVCEDALFSSHYAGASARKMDIGCYFYSAATTVAEAREEADFVVSTIQKYNCSFTLPVYFDSESKPQREIGKEALTKVAKAFCDRLKSKGYFAGIYCSKYWALDNLNMSALSDYTFWLAEYASAPSYTGTFDMWQKTSKGSVLGVSGDVDVNECYRDFPTYIKENGYNGFPVPDTGTTEEGETTTAAPEEPTTMHGFVASLLRLLKLIYDRLRAFIMMLIEGAALSPLVV